ncbi:hypothetical protein FE257_011001 [Aspergillus nanangensis]|uniref:DUF6536 domain-containing protein n=1 Tax=Aspergillus nanangensis TaxID=2582783 RepID=A0AAD4CJE9_ASPNN|nr:hypothetical protein FE257_011001 [Aspergillus nanangensis]
MIPHIKRSATSLEKCLPAIQIWNQISNRSGVGTFSQSGSTEKFPRIRTCSTNDSELAEKGPQEPLKVIPGIKYCAIAASIGLFLNIVFAITAFIIGYSNPDRDGFVTVSLYEGSCSVSKTWSTGLHLAINVLGTAIMSSSSYCAQFLAAPTRNDVDRAHIQGSWLDIGIPSLRNISALGTKKKLLCGVLFLTTIPIHAIYNSVVTIAQSSDAYKIYIAPADYNGQRSLELGENSSSCYQSQMGQSLAAFNADMANSSVDILTKEQCADTFSVSYLSGNKALVILSSNLTWDQEDTMVSGGSGNDAGNYASSASALPFGWMCPGDDFACTESRVQDRLANWQVNGAYWSGTVWSMTAPYIDGQTKDFGLTTRPTCPFSNTDDPLCADLKTMSGFLWSYTPVTHREIHDFTHDPDNWQNSTWAKDVTFHSADPYCDRIKDTSNLFTKQFNVDGCLRVRIEENCQLLFSPLFSSVVIICTIVKVACIIYVACYDRTPRLLTVGDAIASFLSHPDPITRERCFSCIVTGGLLLNVGLSDNRLVSAGKTSLSEIWRLGINTVDVSTIIFRIDTTLLGNTLIANLPQIAISLSYYFYNAVLTTMLMAAEYDRYGVGSVPHTTGSEKPRVSPKKGLRVSGPLQGAQRSTYWLSLPYRYSGPLLLSYAVLHWLVSQSIFYVRVMMFDADQNRVSNFDVNACAWSPLALILSIAMGSLMVVVLLILALRRFRSCIPLAGSCSAALSAACQRPENDGDAASQKVVWGEIVPLESAKDPHPMGKVDFPHCSFTSHDVIQPSFDRFYV